jgi:uncharacterized protein with NAD-binding domain and iron-sulfur cluster
MRKCKSQNIPTAEMLEVSESKQRIAILGGGVGALSAAFALTEAPDWQSRYDITVYQKGWRLGGKGASGRNAAQGQRIEEHGLHTWMGFYENAFWLIQKCYQELGRQPGTPLATWEEAFHKHSQVTVMELIDGEWIPWTMDSPTNSRVPGQEDKLPTPWNYVCLVLQWMLNAFESAVQPVEDAATSFLGRILRWLKRLWKEWILLGESLWSHLHHAHKLAHELPADPKLHDTSDHHALAGLMDQFGQQHLRTLEQNREDNQFWRRLKINLEMGAAIVRGILRDGVLFHGFDCIDQYDFTEWLQRHGAHDPSIWWSAPVRGIYDLVFGYDNGDTTKPNLAAGTALRGCLRMFFGYKGAIFWKMQAGMGDTIFTPLYEVLKRRGVRFEFFQRVYNLGLSADSQAIDRIDMGVQATVKDEILQAKGGYQPLVTVQRLDCWPSEPLYDQLNEGAALRQGAIDLESAWTPWPDVAKRTLQRGKDFDLVVLGISLGAVSHICPELLRASQAWRDMVAHVLTVQTQSFQIWLNRSADELGWHTSERTMATAYTEPLDTWADMSQLIPREDWPETANVKNITYFCGPLSDAEKIPAVLTDPTFPASQQARVYTMALESLQKAMRPVFPLGTQPQDSEALRTDLLVDLAGGKGLERFQQQYFRANIDPSERYVLSPKGSTPYRLRADKSHFANLYLAGDWVATGVNAGCVEAAVMGGLQAARGICGHPKTIVGEKDF